MFLCYPWKNTALTDPGLNSDTLALEPHDFHAVTSHWWGGHDQNEQEGGRQKEERHWHKLDLKEILLYHIFCRTWTLGKKEIILRIITVGLSDPVHVDKLVQNGQTQIFQAFQCQCLLCLLDSGTLSQVKVINIYFDTIISNLQCTYQELSQVETDILNNT